MDDTKTPLKELKNQVLDPPVSSLDLRNIRIKVYGSAARSTDAFSAYTES